MYIMPYAGYSKHIWLDLAAQQRRSFELPQVVLHFQHPHISKKILNKYLMLPVQTLCSKIILSRVSHYWPSQDTCVFWVKSCWIRRKNQEPVQKSILSIGLQPQSPNTNYLSTWQSLEVSGRQPASWNKDNQKQHYLSAFICISKIPATREVTQHSWEGVLQQWVLGIKKKLPINKQQKLTSKNEHTKKGGVFCRLLFFNSEEFLIAAIQNAL